MVDIDLLIDQYLEDILLHIDGTGYELEVFQKIGDAGFKEIGTNGIPRSRAIFADDLCGKIKLQMPREVVQSICLASYYLWLATETRNRGYTAGVAMVLGDCSFELGFIHGYAHSMDYLEECSKHRQAAYGRKGADAKHKSTKALKDWALSEAKKHRGADMDIARKLAAQIPVHLADASKDPQRLIYSTIKASPKPRTDS